MWNKIIKYGKQKYKYHGIKHDCKWGTKLVRRNKSNPNVEQKFKGAWNKKGTRLARRNKSNIKTE
jgi:hypothetical protein